jgi:hypothetical protein
MFYEFVETSTGWRVFWGIDPQSEPPGATPRNASFPGTSEVDILPFSQIQGQHHVPPAA